MADLRLRELERATRQGDEDAGLQLLALRLRGVGESDAERLELAAFLLGPKGLELTERAVTGLPSAWEPGARVPLQTAGRYPGASLRASLTWLDPARDEALLEVGGYFGSRSAPWYEDLLREVVQVGVRHLVLDLRHGAGINSGGIGALLRLHQAIERQDGALAVCFQQPVRVVIEMLGLEAFLEVARDVDDGRAKLRADGTDAPPVLDGDAWLGRLLRWGTRPCARAALAVSRALQAEQGSDERPGGLTETSRLQPAQEAAAAWLARPDAERAEAARLAMEAVGDAARSRPHQANAALWWAYRAAGLAATGIWPPRAPEPLPSQLNLVRRELLVFSLGI